MTTARARIRARGGCPHPRRSRPSDPIAAMTSRRTFIAAGLAGGAALGRRLVAGADRRGRRAGRSGAERAGALDRCRAGHHRRDRAGRCSTARCPSRPRRAPRRHRRDARQRRHARSRACRRRRSRSSAELFALLGFGPARIALARVGPPWRDAGRRRSRRLPRALARQSGFALLRSAYDALHQIVLRRVVRQSALVAGDRLRRAAGAFGMTATARNRPSPTRSAPASPPAGRSSTPRARRATSTLEADVVIVGTGAGGGIAAEILAAAGLTVILVEEGPLQDVARLPHARVRGLSRAVPGIGGAQDAATRRSTSCRGAASAAARRSTGRVRSARRQTTLAVLGARRTGSPASASPISRRGSSGWRRGCRSRPGRCRPTPTTRRSRAARKASASPSAAIRRNVKGCWNLGYCGMGCPINAKQSMLVTTIPGGAGRRARRWCTRARALEFVLERDRVVALTCVGDGRRRRASGPRAGSRCARAPSSPRRRDRHAGAAAAQPGARSARARRQAHVPAPGGRVGGADAGADRRPTTARRRPSTPTTSSTRCRPTARWATSSRRRRCTRSWRRSRCPTTARRHAALDARAAADAGAARAAARRLPSRQPRRHASRCAATARRCSTIR